MISYECDRERNQSVFKCNGDICEILADSTLFLAQIVYMMKKQGFATKQVKKVVIKMLSGAFEVAADIERKASGNHEG
jgi:hypothetical protein